MRRRDFRPAPPVCLEDRSLTSSLAGPPSDPVVFSIRRLELVIQRVQLGFTSFTRFRDPERLGEEVRNAAIPLPFARADGFGEAVDVVVDELREDLAEGVPHAVRTAQRKVIATIRADLTARVRAGDVVLR